MPSERDDPIRLEIRLRGHLDAHWSPWFGGLALVHEPDGTTTLSGGVRDPAQLYGVLAQVRDLGAPLISLTALGAEYNPATHPKHPCPDRTSGQGPAESRKRPR